MSFPVERKEPVMLLPDSLPILKSGKQPAGSGSVCSEQAVNWLVSGRLDLGNESDHPDCVQPVLNALAIRVNDALPDSERHRMWPIILRQPGTAHPEMEPVLSVRLATYLAEQVLHLVRPDDWQVCRDAITAAQMLADNPCEETAASYAADHALTVTTTAAAAYAAAAAASAAYAAALTVTTAAATASSAAAAAAYAAALAAAHAYDAGFAYDLIALLEGAQDECERLVGGNTGGIDPERIERLCQIVGSDHVGAET
jgi:hypothetical protein